jgi:hypothetical protein
MSAYPIATEIYASVEVAFDKPGKNFASFVRMADIFEGIGRVLAGHIQQDFFTTRMLIQKLCRVINWLASVQDQSMANGHAGVVLTFVVNDYVETLLIGMFSHLFFAQLVPCQMMK